jgi:C1A family cysteine protease
MSTKNRKYNLSIERLAPEHLDIFPVKKVDTLPDIVDLRDKMPEVYDQGQLGSCTANALAALIEYITKVMGSRLFLYYNERKVENDIPDDNGAQLSDGVKCLQKYGICLETEWPYDIEKFTICPPEACYKDALKYKALKVKNIKNTIEDMQACLHSGFPFCVGISVYSSFESDEVAQTGMVPMPTETDTLCGGHAVCVVGYDNIKKLWIMRNSWSSTWGDKGYFYLPYEYLTNSDLSSDLWCVLTDECPEAK